MVGVGIAQIIMILVLLLIKPTVKISLLVFWEETASGIEWDDIVGGERLGPSGSVIVDIDPLDKQSNLALID